MSTKLDTWMPFYVADYMADTARLNTEQHGAYLLLLLDYWRKGPPPDNDEVLANITKLTRQQWTKHRAALATLFQIGDGVWKHKRVEEERARAAVISEKRKASGLAGAAAKHGKAGGKKLANATDLPKQTGLQNGRQSQSQLQEDESKEGARKRAPGFDPSTVQLPDWLPRALWCRWCDARQQAKKPITPAGAEQQLANLAKWNAAGHDTSAIIEDSIANGWQGLFEPKPKANVLKTVVPKTGFEQQDYTRGFRGELLAGAQ